MRRRKLVSVILALTLLGGVLCGCAGESAAVQQSSLPELRIGSDNYPPFNYTDENGAPAGIDVDLATEACRRMGYQAKFVGIDWEDKKTLVERGEIDCIWGCFSMDGRAGDYLWAGPYMRSRQVVAVSTHSKITKLSELEGKSIAVQSTTKPEEIFLSGGEGVPKVKEVVSLEDRELIYSLLGKGDVDAISAHETAIRQYMQDYGVEYRILKESILETGLGVAFAKNDTRGIAEQLSAVFEEMRADGTAAQIIGQYLADPEQYLEVEDLVG